MSATARSPSPSTSANSRTLRSSSALAIGASASRTLPPVNTNPASSPSNHSGAATTSKPRWHSWTNAVGGSPGPLARPTFR
jgi:hypothetical protein